MKVNVLVIGSGGREHAITTALSTSPRLGELNVAPGNAGTIAHNVDIDVTDFEAIASFCVDRSIDLVVVGPEQPLVSGLADSLSEAGIRCFGPSAAAAQLEGSKSFAREFAARHGIPGPRCESFTSVESALKWLHDFDGRVVVKADGLAGGKGVIIPETRVEAERAIFDLLSARTMGDAGATVVLEERLEGEELSLFGIADGADVISLGTAQDHKRVGDGDTGPNTGGMGAFSPVPGKADIEPELVERFLRAAVSGMAAEGTPYVGVLYAGIMLTDSGPRLIEYNCRFGDPEAQVILPLLDSDVLELVLAAADGNLAKTDVKIVDGVTAATVVVAAAGYPTSPAMAIPIPEIHAPAGVSVIHSSTRVDGDQVVSCGGRVLNVVGTGTDLAAALDNVYSVVDEMRSDQLFARSDIGWRHAPRSVTGSAATAYAQAGVSLDAAAEVGDRIAGAVISTHDERVVAGHGSFGGVFDLASLSGLDDPLLVATTDGVGTKTILAEQIDSWEGIGADIVNHGVNDVLVQGASPLFFLDTVAAASLDATVVARIVGGMAEACRAAGCVLIGGETAEMPDVLSTGAVDVSGTMIGAVDRANLLPRTSIAPGDLLVGLASSGLHTNGYSLARKVLSGMDLHDPLPGDEDVSIGQALLAVHRSYLQPLKQALADDLISGLVHITGGGLVENIPRVLPEGCGAIVETSSWTWPPLFRFLVGLAGLHRVEAHQTLNLGIGMVAIVAPDQLDRAQQAIPEPTKVIGRVVKGRGVALASG